MRNTQINQTTNEYVRNILDLRISSQLRILNGRTLGDSSGKTTFYAYNGVSIDDYCICNSLLLQDILNFKIHNYHCNLSDHCRISVQIPFNFSVAEQDSLRPLPRNLKWSEAQEQKFRTNTDVDKVNKICSEINRLDLSQNAEQNFNELISRFTSVLYDAVFGLPSRFLKPKKHRKPKHPW